MKAYKMVLVCIAAIATTAFAEQPDEFLPYVQSDGNTSQYLNTCVKGRYGTKAEMKVEWLDLGNSNDINDDVAFLCARSGNNRVYFCHNYETRIGAGYGAYKDIKRDGKQCKWETKRVYTVITEFSATNSEGKVTATMSIDGESKWNETLDMVDTGLDLYLFAMNQNGGLKNAGAARCYGLKIWQDGVLVRDYRPCVKNGRGALYDAVSQTICYSSGAVDFHYDATANVPDDEDIEYVEARGASYVDTGVIGRPGTKAAGEFAFLANEDKSVLDSRIDTGNTRFYMIHNYNSKFMYGYKSYYDTGSRITLGTKYYVETELNVGSQTMFVSEEGSGVTNQIVNATDGSSMDTARSLYLFACNYGGEAKYGSKVRCYWLKIWQDGELKCDYRPCMKNGVPCLYDDVSKRIIDASGQSLFYEPNFTFDVDEKDVAFVDYIESDGYSYLDTGVRGRSDTRAQGVFCWTRERQSSVEKNTYLEELVKGKSRYERCYLGSTSYKNDSTINRFYMLHENDRKLYSGYGKYGNTLSTTISGNTKYAFDINYSSGAQTIDITPDGGETIHAASYTYSDTTDSGGNIFLFAVHDVYQGYAKCEMAARCYGLKLWQDGSLVRDFRPCVYNGKAMLYDMQTRKVFRPSPDILANGNVGSPVESSEPDVYVEYVETDGSQYIDTGIIGRAGTKIEFKESSLSRNSNDDESFIGARGNADTDSRFYMWQHGTQWTLGFGYGTFNRPKTSDPTGTATGYWDSNARKLPYGDTFHAVVSFEAGAQRADIIGTNGSVTNVMNWSISGDINTERPLYLFAANVAGEPQMFCKSRFYWMKIWQDGHLVRYYRPVRLANGYVALWDSVGRQVYFLKSRFGSDKAGYFSAVGPDGRSACNGMRVIIR